MIRRYDAFLIRCWLLEDGGQRLEVIHVHSGKRTLVASLAQAAAWMATWGNFSPAAPDDGTQPGRAPPDPCR